MYLTDVVLADEIGWSNQIYCVTCRGSFRRKNFAAVLDVEEWHKSYPHLRTCDELEFRALDKLGRGSEVWLRSADYGRRIPMTVILHGVICPDSVARMGVRNFTSTRC